MFKDFKDNFGDEAFDAVDPSRLLMSATVPKLTTRAASHAITSGLPLLPLTFQTRKILSDQPEDEERSDPKVQIFAKPVMGQTLMPPITILVTRKRARCLSCQCVLPAV